MFSRAATQTPLKLFKRTSGEHAAVPSIEEFRLTDAQVPSAPPQTRAPRSKKPIFIGLGALAVLALGALTYNWLSFAGAHESTDDAYTSAHMHAVSPRISGIVTNVLVDDNQHVKAGQLLVQLDPNDYQVRLDEALAALEVARNQADTAKTSIELAQANATGKTTQASGTIADASAAISKSKAAVSEAQSAIPQANAELAQRQAEETRAGNDFVRYQKLAEQGAVSIQQRDQAERDYKVAAQLTKAAAEAVNQARARFQQAQESVRQASAHLTQSQGIMQEAQALGVQTQVTSRQYATAQSAIHQAQAAVRDAQLQLSYTNIVAPVDGRIGKKNVEKGQRVQPGQEMIELVGDDVWTVANFKETQLERMRAGEAVDITIDSFPHHKFSGTVDSLSPGSGASFALLPPENATGNFTKIVQRVPVKVVFDKASIKGYEQLVVPGMSAVVSVTVK